MAVFNWEAGDGRRLDYTLLLIGAVALYHNPDILAEDVEWFRNHRYNLARFDCERWGDEQAMHAMMSRELGFGEWYGRNMAALNDGLRSIVVSSEGRFVLVFDNYDLFNAREPEIAREILDIIEDLSRFGLLFGHRFLALVQSNDPRIEFNDIGARPVWWNPRERLLKSRGL